MTRPCIVFRGIVAGCAAGGLSGVAVALIAVLGEGGAIRIAAACAFIGAVCGIPIGLILSVPVTLVAAGLYPVLAEYYGDIVARLGAVVAVGIATGGCLVLFGMSAFAIVIVPVAMIAALVGLGRSRGSGCRCFVLG